MATLIFSLLSITYMRARARARVHTHTQTNMSILHNIKYSPITSVYSFCSNLFRAYLVHNTPSLPALYQCSLCMCLPRIFSDAIVFVLLLPGGASTSPDKLVMYKRVVKGRKMGKINRIYVMGLCQDEIVCPVDAGRSDLLHL